MRLLPAVPLLLCLFPFASPPALAEAIAPAVAEGEVLDQVVAEITPGSGRGRRTLVTRSDLELETRVLLVSRGGIEAAAQPLPDEVLAASLEWLIAEHLLFAEAEQLDLAGVDPLALERELASFRLRFPSEAAWRAFLAENEVVESDVARILRRRMVVDGYVASRLRLGVQVTEAEVRSAWESRKAELGEDSWEWARPNLRAQLERERRAEVAAALVAELRRRGDVRVIVPLGVGKADSAAPAPVERPWYLPGAGGEQAD